MSSKKDVEYRIKVSSDGVATFDEIVRSADKAKDSNKKLSLSFGSVSSAIVVANQAIELFSKAFGSFANMSANVIKLDHQMKSLTATIGDSRNKGQDLRKEILNLQKAYGGDELEMADGLQRLLRESTLDTADAVQVLTEAVRLADTGVTDINTAVTMLNKTMKTYGYEAQHAAAINDIFMIGMRNGAGSMENMNSVLDTIAPLAKTLGVDFSELIAMMTALGQAGISTADMSMTLRSAFTALARPTNEFGESLDSVTRSSITAAIQQKGFIRTLAESVKGTKGGTDAIAKFFGRITAASGIAALTSENGLRAFNKSMLEMADASEHVGKIVTDVLAQVDRTALEQLDLMKRNFSATFAELYLIVLDWANPFMIIINEALYSFRNFVSALQATDFVGVTNSIHALTAALAALIPVLAILNFEATAIAVTKMLTAFKALTPFILLASKALAGFLAGFLLIPWVLDNIQWIWHRVFIAFEKGFIHIEKAIEHANVSIKKFFKIDPKESLEAIDKLERRLRGIVNRQLAVNDRYYNPSLIGDLYKTGSTFLNAFTNDTEKLIKKNAALPKGVIELNKELKKVSQNSKDVVKENTALLDSYKALMGGMKSLQQSVDQQKMMELDYINKLQQEQFKQIQILREQMKVAGILGKEEAAQLNKITKLYNEKFALDYQKAAIKEMEQHLKNYYSVEETMAGFSYKKFQDDHKNKLNEIKSHFDTIKYYRQDLRTNEDILMSEGFKKFRDDLIAKEKLANEMATKLSKNMSTIQQIPTQSLRNKDLKPIKSENEMLDQYRHETAPATKALQQATSVMQIEFDMQKPFMEISSMASEGMLGMVQAGMSGLSAGFSSMMAGPIGMIMNAPDIIGGAIDGLNDFMDKWLEFPDMLLNALPDVINKLSTFVGDFVGKLGDKLPDIIYKLSNSISKFGAMFYTSLIKGLPKLWRGIWNAIPALVAGIIEGFLEGILALGDAIKDLLTGNIDGKKMTEAGVDAVDAVGKAVTGVGSQLFGYVEESGLKQAQEQAKEILAASEKGAGWFMRAWKALEKVWLWIRDLIVSSVTFLLNLIVGTILAITTPIFAAFIVITEFFIAVVSSIVVIIVAIIEFLALIFWTIIDAFVWVFYDLLWKTVIEPIIHLFIWVFVDILWGIVFKPIIDSFIAIINFFGEVFDSPIKAWNNLIQKIKDIWTVDMGKAVDNMKEAGANLWENFKKAVGEAFDSAIQKLTKFWDKLGGIFERATDKIKGFFTEMGTNIANGLKAAFKGVGNWFKDLFKIEPSEGKVEQWLGFDFPWVKFAEGGYVSGTAKVQGDSYSNDIIPALLSPEEYVLPRSVTQNDDLMRMIMTLIKNGKEPLKLAGGFFGKAKSAISSAGSAVVSGAQSVGSAVASGAGAVWEGAKDVGGAIVDTVAAGFQKIGGLIVPDNIADLWNGITSFFGELDFSFLKSLVTDPVGTLQSFVKGSFDFFRNIFKDNIPKMMGFNKGGYVDTIPAMLTRGEYVLNRDAVSNLGVGLLDRLNKGGNISAGTSGTGDTYNVTLNIVTEQPIDEKFIRSKLMPEIEKNLRRSSLDGKRVVSTNGVK